MGVKTARRGRRGVSALEARCGVARTPGEDGGSRILRRRRALGLNVILDIYFF